MTIKTRTREHLGTVTIKVSVQVDEADNAASGLLLDLETDLPEPALQNLKEVLQRALKKVDRELEANFFSQLPPEPKV